jgi:hypothetical protein
MESPSGIVIRVRAEARADWVSQLTDSVVDLNAQVRRAFDDGQTPILIAVTCPGSDTLRSAPVDAFVEAVRGYAQAIALEMPGSRCSVVVCNDGQDDDLDRTASMFFGPDGGFIAGALLDVRSAA